MENYYPQEAYIQTTNKSSNTEPITNNTESTSPDLQNMIKGLASGSNNLGIDSLLSLFKDKNPAYSQIFSLLKNLPQQNNKNSSTKSSLIETDYISVAEYYKK